MSIVAMNQGVYPDYESLGDRLRGIDKLEASATQAWGPAEAIRNSIELSSKWWIGCINGQEEFAVGVAPMPGLSGWGAPWMLSTDKVFKIPKARREFLRRTHHFVDEAAKGYDCLFNLISEHNHDSKRWLRFAGFLIGDDRPVQVFRGFRFLEFIRATPGGAYDLDK